MALALFDQPTTIRLQALVDSVREGKLLLPEFQRPFEWKDEQRLLLFDSILSGLPIGSLLVWRTKRPVKVKTELEGFSLPLDAKEMPRNYVLDGQQRVFTLYAALAVEAQEPEPGNERRRWPIFLDLEADQSLGGENGESRFKLARRDRKPPITWLPLSKLFQPKKLLAHQKQLYTANKDALAERAEEVANTFKDYLIALVPILTDDLRLVTQSFQRINSQGTPMGEPHMLRALTYTEAFDLTQRFDLFTAELPWGRLDHQILVNTLKALLGLSIYGADLSELIQQLGNSDTTVLDQMEQGVREAVKFLNRYCGIQSEAAMPYTYQLVALAYAAAHGDDLGAAAKPLQHWLWATTYTEYFTGMTAGQLRRAFDHVRNICKGSDPLPTDMPTTCSPLKRFRWPSVRALAFMHLLAQQFPKDQGKRVGSSEARLLARGGETSNLLYPDRPASDPANRFLVAPERAAALRRALFKDSPDADPLRESHVLPPRKDLASRSVEKTLEWRRAQLRSMEVDFIRSLGLKVREAD